ncbi:superoxide dismutase [Candidatus Gottesmanbacteria bacterium]|nr:superoxide dismutase [Candidatus Gottesmanbacteria bacterium]
MVLLFAMFTLPDLPYPYNALEPYIDERTMQIHHDKHHGAYVKNLNDALAGQDALLSMPVEELMKNLSKVPEAVRTKVRNNGGGHANHSFFWEVMSPKAGGQPSGELAKAIESAFGSFAQFQEKFSAAGMGRFGSGWVWLISEKGKLTITDTPNQDNPWMEGKTPILGLDVWEHAYYLKYQNLRADYIKAWWNVVNWREVGRRYKEFSS